jgi:hypothetical protein
VGVACIATLRTRLILVHMAELLQPENGIHQVPQATSTAQATQCVRLLVCMPIGVLTGYVRTSMGRWVGSSPWVASLLARPLSCLPAAAVAARSHTNVRSSTS